MKTPRHDIEEIKRAMRLLLDPDQVVEIRAIGAVESGWRAPHTISGYFMASEIDALAQAIARIKPTPGLGVYWTLNPVHDALLARACNRVRGINSKDPTTSDADILKRRYLPIDFDAKRPSGVSASEAEHAAAHHRARAVRQKLRERGWPEGAYADSGNGAHLLYAIDEEADDGGLVEDVLAELQEVFGDDPDGGAEIKVKIDVVNKNQGRIWKVYGTVACKGDSTPRRPWRVSRIIDAPERLEVVTTAQLQAFAAPTRTRRAVVTTAQLQAFAAPTRTRRAAAASKPKGSRGRRSSKRDSDSDNVALVERIVGPSAIRRKDGYQGDGTLWELDCPFDDSHKGSAYAVVWGDGCINAACHHNSCSWQWAELADRLEPGYIAEREEKQREYEERQRAREERAQTGRAHLRVVAGGAASSVAYSAAPSVPRAVEVADVGDSSTAALEAQVSDRKAVTKAVAEIKAGLEQTQSGNVKTTLTNVTTILARDPRWQGVLAFDELALTVVTLRKPPWGPLEASKRGFRAGQGWRDSDDNRLRIWLQREYEFEPPQTRAREAIDLAAERCAIHPVRQWLESLGDGAGHDADDSLLNTWLSRFAGAKDTPYTRAAGRLWLIAAVARAYPPKPDEDGVKADNVLVLEGAQGARKSTLLRSLVPVERWFGDSTLAIGEKDGLLSLRGKWIYELAELDGYTSRRETAAIKAYLTSKVDDYRAPYGARNDRLARQCLFCATANKPEYFWDETGNRRFWPVKVGTKRAINVTGMLRVLETLWAQARAAYMAGEQWWPTPELEPLFKREQRARLVADVWEHAVRDWLAERFDGVWNVQEDQRAEWIKSRLPGADLVLQRALGVERSKMNNKQRARISSIMSALGWEQTRPVIEGKKRRVFAPVDDAALRELVPESSAQEPDQSVFSAEPDDGCPF